MKTYLNKINKLISANIARTRQLASEVRAIEFWDLETNVQGHLAVQGLDTLELIDQYGSPLLVVNKQRLVRDAEDLKQAFQYAPVGSKILYSYKTNCIPGILRPLHEVGIGAEVISPYELWLAEQLGVPDNMILYNGVDKSDESLERAIRLGILSINIDQFEEIDRTYAVATRLNQSVNVGVRLALSSGSQFGLDLQSGEALAACEAIKARSDRLKFHCIHVHVTSNAKTADTHKACAVKALEFARTVRDKTGLVTGYLDIGGGFGVPTTKNMNGIEYGIYRVFGVLPRAPRLAESQPIVEFIREVVDAIEKTCNTLHLEVPRLLIEPGRLVTSRAEFLLASVRAIKRRANGPTFAITDAGRLSVTFPCDFEYHEVFVADRPKAPLDACYEVKGRICTSADWMFKNRYLPELRAGDVLAVMDAGAYFSSYSSNFAFPRPAIIMVDGGTARVIRQEETFEHLTAMDS
jgi:diaminopimelate decarboxylase